MEKWIEEDRGIILSILVERAPEVKKIMDLIRSGFGYFTAEDVYNSSEQPDDLSMYLALAVMEERGEIESLFVDSEALTHSEMSYVRLHSGGADV